MAEVLAVRQMPWGLTGFALVLALYTAGFADGRPATTTFGIAGLVICALLTYATLLAEPQRRTTWQKIFLRLQTGDFRAAFLQMPSWPGTLLLAFAFAIWCKFAIEATMSPNQLADAQTLGPLLWILLLTRDCAIALYFWFAPKSRRAGAALCLYLLLLYGLPFWLVRGIVDETLILVWILPGLGRGLLPWAVTLVHLGIALAMLRRRWMATDPARL